MATFEIRKDIPRPTHARNLGGAALKYPLDRMEPGDCIIVSKAEHGKPEDDSRDLRNRVAQAVRTYKKNVNEKAHLMPGYDETKYTPVEFTVLTLGVPPKGQEGAWAEGDIGIWRDS